MGASRHLSIHQSQTSNRSSTIPHGGDGRRVAAQLGLDPEAIIDLSASLNPFAPDVAGLVAQTLPSLNHYPDSSMATEALAEHLDVDSSRLVLTNGGAEAIALTANYLRAGQVIEPEFSLYRRHLDQVEPPNNPDLIADGPLRWRSNPNNPLGQLAKPDEEALVWDEAFYPLATGHWSRGDNSSWRLGSLTKLWSCPGLRIGFVVAPTDHAADHIRTQQPRWAVNSLALAVIPQLLDQTDLPQWQNQIATLRSHFVAEVENIGFQVTPSAANWVLIHDVDALRQHLLPGGVVARDCSNFGLPGTTRLAVPRPLDMAQTLSALQTAWDQTAPDQTMDA